MEHQNNTRLTEMSDDQSRPFMVTTQKSNNPWKIISIIAIVLALGLGAGFAVFFIKSTDDAAKIKSKDETITNLNDDLTAFRNATGTQDPGEVVLAEDIDFESFYTAMTTAKLDPIPTLSLVQSGSGASYIKTVSDGQYQIATFAATANDSGWIAYFYRTIPSTTWIYSNFSGQGAPNCTDATQDELAAFKGIIECQAQID